MKYIPHVRPNQVDSDPELEHDMTCCDFKKVMDVFLAGQLERLELDEFSEHLIECSECEVELLTAATVRR